MKKNNKFYLELSLNHCLYVCLISINIKDPLFTSNNGQLVNIFDFNPKKLSIKKVTDAVSDDPEYIYYVKYDKDPFYLVIDDLKGYFRYYKDKKELEFIMEDQVQAKIYNQIWDKIKELINSVDGVNFKFSDYFRNRGIIRLDTDDTLPLDSMVNVSSVTIFIKSIDRTYHNRFYPQIHLANCIYVQSN